MSPRNVAFVADLYPTMADGGSVPFRPSKRPALTAWLLEHIVERHADSPRSGAAWPSKSKFPADWTVAQIAGAVDRVLENPDRPLIRLGDKIRFERTVDGLLLRVQVRVDLDPPEIWNAYPVEEDR